MRRIKGAILGLACGDALGAPVEFMEAALIRRRYGKLRRMMAAGSCQAGEGTDETGMMLASAEGLIANPEDPGPAVGRRLRTWMETAKDVPAIVRAAITRSHTLSDWVEISRGTPQAASGEAASVFALPTVLPVALSYADTRQRMTLTARVSALTHWDPRGEMCALIFAEWIAALVDGARREEAWQQALHHARRADDLAPQEPGTPGRELPQEAFERLETAAKRSYEDLQPSGYAEDAVEALEASAWCVLSSPNAQEAIVAAVGLGGAADTLGALTGAVAGASWGPEALPTEWIEALTQRSSLEDAARDCALVRANGE